VSARERDEAAAVLAALQLVLAGAARRTPGPPPAYTSPWRLSALPGPPAPGPPGRR
jgi:hypothetical protein